MSSRVRNVSIDLRNLDEIVLEGESDKEDAGPRSRSEKGPAVEDILKMHDNKAMHRWNTVFIIVSCFGVFIDPLVCYINAAKEDHMCFKYDYFLLFWYICLRSAVDVFYLIDIVIFFCGICKKRKGKRFGACCWKSRSCDEKTVAPLKEVIKNRYLLLLSNLSRIIVSFPNMGLLLLGLLIPSSYQLHIDPFYLVITITPFQYIPRVFLIYGFQRWRPIKKTTTGRMRRWLKLTLDFLPFILSSHAARQRLMMRAVISTPISLSFNLLFSSFGSNLSTSMQPLEIFFSVVISISGMVLFLVYLSARVQDSQARSNELKLKEKKHLMRPDIDLWLSKNDLSNMKTMTKGSWDRKTITNKKKALKTVIIENMDRLDKNKDIDALSIISVLPIKFKRSVTRLLCIASLKKVPMFATLNGEMLKVICEHLKPVIYTVDNCIVKEGKPLGMMLFITQGLAWSYTSNTANNINGGGTSCGSSTNKWLKRGDFYGEELLNSAFKCPSFSDLPISTRTVVSQDKVEAFVLRASDLKSIVCKFWWHFARELQQADLEQWENSAASSIQGAWRNRLARDRRSNRWDKFTVEY